MTIRTAKIDIIFPLSSDLSKKCDLKYYGRVFSNWQQKITCEKEL
jgi:hypothetical protein